MATRDNPYGAFNFMVQLGSTGGQDGIAAGFSDVSGLGNEVKFSEYRNGNDKANHVRKVPNTNTTDDVTLKRGLIGDLRLFDWLKATRDGEYSPQTVTITLLDERRNRGLQLEPARRAAEEVGRPDVRGQGRRRGRHGGAAPGGRADRLRVGVTGRSGATR